jgi:SAM-dependent methyltransferase
MSALERSERERAASDAGRVWEVSHRWHTRGAHVFSCPNTLRHEALFDELAARHAKDGRVLDLGCGQGASSEKLLSFSAAHVLGIDISELLLAQAFPRAIPGRLEFRKGDVAQPIDGRFDLIFGRAILHHLDYPPILERLYRDNLQPGGALLFMEPLGANLLSLLFRILVPAAHTPDERPFTLRDTRWFRRSFADVEIYPYNYLSYPVGLVSSVVARSADNAALRLCDRADTWLARHVRVLESRFRQAIFVVRKPVTRGGNRP